MANERLTFEIDAPLRPVEDAVLLASLVDRVLGGYVSPWLESVGNEQVETEFELWTRGKLPPARSLPLTDRNLRRARQGLEAGRCDLLSVGVLVGEHGYQRALSFEIDFGERDVDAEAPRTGSVRLSIPRELVAYSQAVASQLVALVKELAPLLETRTGYVTVDSTFSHQTWYERAIFRHKGREESGSWLRGYFWGNLLTATHIDRLGGVESVRRDAPVATVEDIGDGRRPFLWLQLTDSPFVYDNEQLRRLGEYLDPALPRREAQEHQASASPRAVPPRSVVGPEPGASNRLEAIFKWEDAASDGEHIGPVFVYDPDTNELWTSPDWLRLSEAQALAAAKGWRFNIDL